MNLITRAALRLVVSSLAPAASAADFNIRASLDDDSYPAGTIAVDTASSPARATTS